MRKHAFMLKAAAIFATASLAVTGCTLTSNAPTSTQANALKRQSIDTNINATLSRLYSTIPGSRELTSKARGVLVFPSVLQAGLVLGGQYGEGALRINDASVGYYSTTSASVGLQVGAQSKAIIILFMTKNALDEFRASEGWSIGGDASVAFVKVGANGTVDTTTATAPVEVFVLTNTGLMGDLSLSGTKISRLNI